MSEEYVYFDDIYRIYSFASRTELNTRAVKQVECTVISQTEHYIDVRMCIHISPLLLFFKLYTPEYQTTGIINY